MILAAHHVLTNYEGHVVIAQNGHNVEAGPSGKARRPADVNLGAPAALAGWPPARLYPRRAAGF
jgi:hypothetical protein